MMNQLAVVLTFAAAGFLPVGDPLSAIGDGYLA